MWRTPGGLPGGTDCPEIPFRRPPDCCLTVLLDHCVPERSVHPVVLERLDRLEDSLDGGRRQGYMVRVAVHEADVLAVWHNLEDVGRQQSTLSVCPARPMQDRAALEVTAAANQRQASVVPPWFRPPRRRWPCPVASPTGGRRRAGRLARRRKLGSTRPSRSSSAGARRRWQRCHPAPSPSRRPLHPAAAGNPKRRCPSVCAGTRPADRWRNAGRCRSRSAPVPQT